MRGIRDQIAAGLDHASPDGSRPDHQLSAITAGVTELVSQQNAVERRVFEALSGARASRSSPGRSSTPTTGAPCRTCSTRGSSGPHAPGRRPRPSLPLHLQPVAQPRGDAARAGHRGSALRPGQGARPLLPRFVACAERRPLPAARAPHRIAARRALPGLEVESVHTFRVTRNADLDLDEDEAEDLLAAVEIELRRRRFGRAVRLEVSEGTTDEVIGCCSRSSSSTAADLVLVDGLLDLTALHALHASPRPDLKDEPCRRRPSRAAGHDRGGGRLLPSAARRRRARAPSLRQLHDVGRALHQPGRGRPCGPDDQADAVPDLGRLADREGPRRGGPSAASRSPCSWR